MSHEKRLLRLKERELELLRKELKKQKELPHLYSEKKLYGWAKDFIETDNKECYICGANQISKSSTLIRKAITWATEPERWPKLWKTQPNLFWYLYPDADTATSEFDTKWMEWMPMGEMKDDVRYGWRADYQNKKIKNVYFNSGITLSFKYYTQDVANLQAGSVYALFCLVDGTKVFTKTGEKNIEDVGIGEFVLGRNGFEMVVGVGSRESDVYEVSIGKKKVVTSPEHPFFTKRGWVEAKDLLPGDVCFILAKWQKDLLQIWYYLTKFYSEDILKVLTEGKVTTGEVLAENSSMWRFGRSITKRISQKVLSYTTKISTHLIMTQKILSVLVEKNIQGYIRKMSGGKLFGKILFAPIVENLFSLGHLRKVYQGTAQRNVLSFIMGKISRVSIAVGRFFVGLGIKQDSVLQVVQINGRHKVNVLSVTGSHTFFANDILTHNCDEEIPTGIIPEISARLNATDGYANYGFTATLGQDYFLNIIEGDEKPEAWKKQVSLYDCMEYWDKTPSLWDVEKIKRATARCTSKKEIERRIMGRFVKDDDSDLLIPKFTEEKNVVTAHPLPKNWLIYGGIDSGSGTSDSKTRKYNHAAAFVFIAVSPDFRMARIFGGRKLEGIKTTAADILQYYREYMREKNITPVQQTYDWADADLYTIATRQGMNLTKADKDRKSGFQLMNTLFDRGVLKIHDTDELRPLIREILNLSKHTSKGHRAIQDDFVDCTRYALKIIPFDWTFLNEMEFALDKVQEEKLLAPKTELDLRREFVFGTGEKPDGVEKELDEWAEMFDSY